jgi:hypothetical protein
LIELVVTSKEDQVVVAVTALYLAAIMLSTICISVWIAMFQAANIAKATNVKVFEHLHFQSLLQLPVYSTSAKSLQMVLNHW